MKTQNTKLSFEKRAIVELNNETLKTVIGGTKTYTQGCFLCIRSSNGPSVDVLDQLKQA